MANWVDSKDVVLYNADFGGDFGTKKTGDVGFCEIFLIDFEEPFA